MEYNADFRTIVELKDGTDFCLRDETIKSKSNARTEEELYDHLGFLVTNFGKKVIFRNQRWSCTQNKRIVNIAELRRQNIRVSDVSMIYEVMTCIPLSP
mgnify:CR=1 FL=1